MLKLKKGENLCKFVIMENFSVGIKFLPLDILKVPTKERKIKSPFPLSAHKNSMQKRNYEYFILPFSARSLHYYVGF